MNSLDPILAAAIPHVQALPALTQPFGTHFTEDYYYFRSAQPNLATIRTDGKRISFQRGLHKTNIIEDIKFLRQCIALEPNGPFSEVTGADIAIAEEILDPATAMEKRLRAKIMAELEAAGMLAVKTSDTIGIMNAETPSLAFLNHNEAESEADARMRQASEEIKKAYGDGNLIAGVDASAAARARLAAMSAGKVGGAPVAGAPVLTPLTGYAVPMLTPVSSSDIAGVSAGSTGSSGGSTSATTK